MSSLDGSSGRTLPFLPLKEWESTKETLHRYAQIVGKIRLEYAPYRNRWWHVPLYVSTRGLTTDPLPYGDVTFEISFNLLDNRLEISGSDGGSFSFTLDDLPVAEFYRRLFEGLGSLGVDVFIDPRPFDLDDERALEEYFPRYLRPGVCEALLADLDVGGSGLKEFSGHFIGKQSPVQLYWHSFGLAITRFSGRRAPERPDADRVMHETYSHEVINFGFWPEGGTALPMYEDFRRSGSPKETLLESMQSACEAGTRTAGWDMEEFERSPVA